MTSFTVVIPARYASTRLPGKALADIAGRPMIYWVHRQALASGADEVIVATDDERIAAAVETFGGRAELTGGQHVSGTDRIAELAARLGWSTQRIVVNVQGDEPLLPSKLPAQVAGLLGDRPEASIATLTTAFVSQAEFEDPNTAKVVVDAKGFALYFSRAPIPHTADGRFPAQARRHIGIYAYRVGSLRELTAAPPAPLERLERLEQLRALHLGLKIAVAEAVEVPAHGVDTPADLEAVRAIIAQR